MLYIILALSGLLPAAWVIYRRKDAALVATYFLAAAFVHTADWIASGVLGLYKYHPGLFSDIVLDDATGVVLAELIFVGSFAVVLVAYIPRWWGALIGAAVVTVMEIIFHAVGALEYDGWALWLTSAGFIVYFLLVRTCWLNAAPQRPMCGWPHVLQRLSVAIVCNGLFEITLWATQAVYMNVSLLPSKDENQALLRFLWHVGISVPLVYSTLFEKRRLLRLIAATLLSIAANRLALLAGIRQFKAPWNPEVVGLLQGVFFMLAGLVDHWIEAWSAKRSGRK